MLKKRYLFLIVIVCFFAISAVSAQDNSTSDIVSVSNDVNSLESNINSIANDTDTLKVSNDEVLTAGNSWYVNGSVTAKGNGSINNPYNNLSYAILKARDNDVIYIASGTYTGEENVNLNINKHLSLVKWDDENPIFDGQNNKRIFIVNVNSINILGLTFKNGKSDYGGAIYFTDNISNSNINACFEHNTVSDNGGAIYFENYVNNCNISGDFINNTATYNGGAIYFEDDVNNCNISGDFISNIATHNGGAIYSSRH